MKAAQASSANGIENRPLRVLLLEDNAADADLLTRNLRNTGYQPEVHQAYDAATMTAALDQKTFDLVICDYKLPSFDVQGAIEVLKARKLDLPFIVVSGIVGEKAAVEVMKAGAHDFIAKDNLSRLAPAIDRELRDAGIRAERTSNLEKLSHLAAIVDSTGEAIISQTLEGVVTTWNAGAAQLFGYTEAQALGNPVTFLVPDELRPATLRILDQLREGKSIESFETVRTRRDGTEMDVYISFSPIRTATGEVVGSSSIVYDITERKKLEDERTRMIKELNDTLSKVKTLSGLLPICASCKKIRDDKGYWQRLETFVHEHSNAEFSHSICPDCVEKLYPEYVTPKK